MSNFQGDSLKYFLDSIDRIAEKVSVTSQSHPINHDLNGQYR